MSASMAPSCKPIRVAIGPCMVTTRPVATSRAARLLLLQKRRPYCENSPSTPGNRQKPDRSGPGLIQVSRRRSLRKEAAKRMAPPKAPCVAFCASQIVRALSAGGLARFRGWLRGSGLACAIRFALVRQSRRKCGRAHTPCGMPHHSRCPGVAHFALDFRFAAQPRTRA